MPAIANVTLKDNANVDVIFIPSNTDANGVTTWYSSASVLDARRSISQRVRAASKTSSVSRVSFKVVVPVMDLVDTSKRVGECVATVEFVLPKAATETQRLDLRKHLDTLLQHANATAAVQNLESVY